MLIIHGRKHYLLGQVMFIGIVVDTPVYSLTVNSHTMNQLDFGDTVYGGVLSICFGKDILSV